MNQVQRKFLIDKIKEQVNIKIKYLRDARPEPPSLNNYLFRSVMNNTFEIKSNEELKELIRQKALNAKAGNSTWMATRSAFGNDRDLSFYAEDFFIVPNDYKELREKYDKSIAGIDKEIADITTQSESLITRIQLASDKVLQTMINEVDDMGDISLMDTTIKTLFLEGAEKKKLN